MANSTTDLSLLAKLRSDPYDEPSWEQFVSYYGPQIQNWAKRWGLQTSDANDLTQTVLVALARQMRRFEYQPGGRFRSWLKTVAYRAWVDLLAERKKRAEIATTDSLLQALANEQAREGFLAQLEEAANRELLELAMQRVQQRVQPQTWEAFRLTQLENESPESAAAALGMKVGSVYVARSRVRQLLLDAVELLDHDRV